MLRVIPSLIGRGHWLLVCVMAVCWCTTRGLSRIASILACCFDLRKIGTLVTKQRLRQAPVEKGPSDILQGMPRDR